AAAAQVRLRRLRPDRARDADRPRREERHPDRRVREDEARGGAGARRGGAGGREAPAASDPDDLARVHPRLRPPLHRVGRGRLFPAHPRDLGHRRHDRGDRARDLHHPRAVRARRATLRGREEARRQAGGRGPGRGPRMIGRRAVAALAAAAGLSGCAVGPNYKRPEIKSPEAFYQHAGPSEARSLADAPWWQVFDDPTLKALVEEALEQGFDARLAIARMDEARARYGVARSEYWPQIGYAA